jgi:hypothetical protein
LDIIGPTLLLTPLLGAEVVDLLNIAGLDVVDDVANGVDVDFIPVLLSLRSVVEGQAETLWSGL